MSRRYTRANPEPPAASPSSFGRNTLWPALPILAVVIVPPGCNMDGHGSRHMDSCDDCGTGGGNPGQDNSATVTVWRSYTIGNPADVRVDGGVIGTLTQATASPPACGSTTSPAWVSTPIALGSHLIDAAEQGGGQTWGPWTCSFASDDCAWIELP